MNARWPVSRLVFAVARVAFADAAADCADASLHGQTARDHGKLIDARTAFVTCSRAECPALIQKDCSAWLAEIDPRVPSVVLAMRDENGHDIAQARVSLDGAPLVDKLDGRPVMVDPGEHVFRFEVDGKRTIEQRVVIRVGEKDRAISGALEKLAPPPIVVLPPNDGRAGKRVAAAVFGGVGAVALGLFAGLGASGLSDIDHLRKTCAPTCTQSQLDAAQVKLIGADVSLYTGIVALGVGVFFLVASFTGAKPATRALRVPSAFVATF
jgi:hypothetical protein